MSVMSLFPSSFSLFLDGQSIVVMERGGRGSADHFPTEAESDVGHVPLVVSSRLGACASSDSRSGAAKSILSSVEGLPGPGSPYSTSSMVFLYVSVRNSDPAGTRARAKFLENDKPGRGMASPGLLKQPNDRNRGPTGDSRWRSGSAHPGWAVLGVNATPP